MENFRIAAVQMNALKGDLDHNIEVHRRIAGEAAKGGCRLVMFPELSTTAHYGDMEATSLAEGATDGRIYQTMHALAKEFDVIISYGFCESAHGTHYNSHALVGPGGMIGVQRKVHASGDEYFYFRAGRTLDVFDVGFCRIGTLICYDMHFFEAWRVLALKGADVLLLPHASRSARGKKLTAEEQMRQLRTSLDGLPGRVGVYSEDNSVFAVSSNQWGYNGHSTHSGGAFVVGPDGKLLAKAEPILEDLWISAEVDPDLLSTCRSATNSVLKMRRPEVYGEITRMI